MAQKYYSFVTNLGLGQITNAIVLGGKVDLKYFAVGDGGGEGYTPEPSMSTLKHEVWRGNITGYRIDSEFPNDIFITGIVPANVGGFTIREMAAFDSNGTMIAIATLADIVKPTVDEGESADAELTIHITVENAEVLNCMIDPNVIVATKADVQKMGDSIKSLYGQAGGIATLNSSGKLAQMPTAADVGAIKLCWSDLINEATATPNKYNFDDYITPGDVVSVDNYASAQSIANIPEAAPGKLYVLPLRTDDQGRNDIMQEYHTVTGNIWCRPRYYYSGNTWSAWGTSANCTRVDSGVYIDLPGGMHICVGSQTYTKVEINNQTNAGCYVSGRLYFNGFPKQYRYAPRCLISLSVGSNGPYWLSVDSNGPSTARPQGFLLASTIGITVATVTLSYFAIGIS